MAIQRIFGQITALVFSFCLFSSLAYADIDQNIIDGLNSSDPQEVTNSLDALVIELKAHPIRYRGQRFKSGVSQKIGMVYGRLSQLSKSSFTGDVNPALNLIEHQVLKVLKAFDTYSLTIGAEVVQASRTSTPAMRVYFLKALGLTPELDIPIIKALAASDLASTVESQVGLVKLLDVRNYPEVQMAAYSQITKLDALSPEALHSLVDVTLANEAHNRTNQGWSNTPTVRLLKKYGVTEATLNALKKQAEKESADYTKTESRQIEIGELVKKIQLDMTANNIRRCKALM